MAKRIKITPEYLLEHTEIVELSTIRPHPLNPNNGDVEMIGGSVQAHGLFRAAGISQDNYLLFGNHTYFAALKKGETRAAVHRLPFQHDDPQALEIMEAENGSRRNAVLDPGLHEAVLNQILAQQGTLDGTTFSQAELDALVKANSAEPELPEPEPDKYQEQYAVMVVCEDEDRQQEVFERLQGEGYNVKVVST